MESMESNGYKECGENAIDRVVNLPVVMSTWNAMHNYYTSVKKKYPTVTPYLETAENLTASAANMAMVKSKPVVDILAPTVNCYANKGLDTLENKVPIITKQPDEIYAATKSKATNMLTNRVNNALDLTEKYVDYYLPSDEKVVEMEDVSFDDDDDDSDMSSASDETNDDLEEKSNPRERIRSISNKVRQRSYNKAMKKWRGVNLRSRETLSKLNFTVDLIQYAQGALDSSGNVVSAANDKLMTGMTATLGGLQNAADSVNNEVEKRVLVKARNLTQQLNASCQSALTYVQNSPNLHPLLEQAVKAKKATEDLYATFSDKTSISQLSNTLVQSTRPKIKFVEDTLLQVFETLSEQPPISWLTPDLDIDPLGGMEMEEIEKQLYDGPRQPDGVLCLPKRDQEKKCENKDKEE